MTSYLTPNTEDRTPSMTYQRIDSPVGPLLIAGDADGLNLLWFAGPDRLVTIDPAWTPDRGALDGVRRELDEYFAGRLRRFTSPLKPRGTPFQRSVWSALCEIPYGETISYAELARRIANPNAVRAVGLANGQNPIAIIVPCHRVIGSDGSLTGYGGGMPTKKALLELERGERRLL
jgi:methylated-DNA-[protein]-cysteine S-methyltransferase